MDINQIADLTGTWCRMWSENPALAHDLMPDDCVQWAAATTGLDSVVGPTQQERFVTAYRAQHINVFAPRTIADGDMFAYLWDVILPDGTVKSGIDVNVLHGRRIRENWTFVAERRRDEPDPAPGDPAAVEDIVRIVTDWGSAQRRTVHRRPVVDAANGRAAVLRTCVRDGAEVGGVDLVAVRGGTLEPIWSVTGTRPFRY